MAGDKGSSNFTGGGQRRRLKVDFLGSTTGEMGEFCNTWCGGFNVCSASMLRSGWSQGLARMQRDKAPVEWS